MRNKNSSYEDIFVVAGSGEGMQPQGALEVKAGGKRSDCGQKPWAIYIRVDSNHKCVAKWPMRLFCAHPYKRADCLLVPARGSK